MPLEVGVTFSLSLFLNSPILDNFGGENPKFNLTGTDRESNDVLWLGEDPNNALVCAFEDEGCCGGKNGCELECEFEAEARGMAVEREWFVC